MTDSKSIAENFRGSKTMTHFERLFEKLNKRQRTAVNMLCIYGFTNKEISEKMGISQSFVKTTLREAFKVFDVKSSRKIIAMFYDENDMIK